MVGRSLKELWIVLLRPWRAMTSREKLSVAAIISLSVLGSVVVSFSPLFLSFVVNDLGKTNFFASFIFILIYCVAVNGSRAILAAGTFLFVPFRKQIEARIERAFYEDVLGQEGNFFLHYKIGGIGRDIHDATLGYMRIFSAIALSIFPIALQEIIAVVIVMRSGLPLDVAICLFVFIVSYGILYFLHFRGETALYSKTSVHETKTASITTEILSHQEIIRSFGREDIAVGSLVRAREEGARAWMLFSRQSMLHVALRAALAAGGGIIILGLTGWRVWSGTASVGDFVMVSAYLIATIMPVEQLGYVASELGQGMEAVARCGRLLSRPRMQKTADDNMADVPDKPLAIDVRDLTFSYQEEDRAGAAGDIAPALCNVTFSLPAGGKLALVGRSGSGKSTLAKLLLGLYPVLPEHVFIDSRDVATLPVGQLRNAIALVPQEAFLFHDTLRANLLFAKPDATEHEIERALEYAGLTELMVRLPEGLETIVGSQGARLSGGERQRVSLARAFLRKPRLVIFDEPTSALDAATERALQERIAEMTRDVTTITIAHRLSTIVESDEILVLDGGRVVERGDHATLLSANGLYAAFWKDDFGEKGV
ncbi:ABC transporter ATP-binding protein [Brytella acorum]|uniref:ABC transporter ATP-binding protein n=1 Tax=Brytella acorum TaxID=2959299 RepID=A0AA35XZD2_9PROT|nr:ABC transporter ATP-binding protein [Brytella acorum]CAI9122264.1 ABC transporter ATP-binding protein [Brytella acorum]